MAEQAQIPLESALPKAAGESLWTKIGLATFAFLLGLVANYVTQTFFTAKREGMYSVLARPIVSVSQSLPAELQPIPLDIPRHITRFDIRVENTGSLQIKDSNVLLEFNDQAVIISANAETNPRREVPFKTEKSAKNEFRISSLTLEPSQSATAILYVKSEPEPFVNTYFSGGGGELKWSKASSTYNLSLQESLTRIIYFGLLAIVVPGLLNAIPSGIALFIFTIIP
jgi:hypothetical protein